MIACGAHAVLLALVLSTCMSQNAVAEPPVRQLKVQISWGHASPQEQPFYISLLPHNITVADLKPISFEPGDTLQGGVCYTHAGHGDVDGVELVLSYPERKVEEIGNLQRIWKYLVENSDPDTARRLKLDPAFRPDGCKLTVQMDPDGTRGFSLTLDQLLTTRVFWVPELDVFVSVGDAPISFEENQNQLRALKTQRVIQGLEREPEATYEQYASQWQDMGSPAYQNPAAVAPGQVVCVAWDSSIHKFGIDRGGGVWNDYGNSDHFQFALDFANPPGKLETSRSPNASSTGRALWLGQELCEGLPVITTTLERSGVRYDIEQFAYPLHGPPDERRGDVPMLLLERVRLTELLGRAQKVSIPLTYRRDLPSGTTVVVRTNGPDLLWENDQSGAALLAIELREFALQSNSCEGTTWQTNHFMLSASLPAKGSGEFVVKLPSPAVAAGEREALLAVDYTQSRSATLNFWSNYVAHGAQFSVPEHAVNDLFRANLWHASRLPRRHGGPGAKLDLPYSNFAYDQNGTPWPINQSVYVDYMLYDLRGYHALSAEELEVMYRNNQEPSGYVGGFANWGVYTPGMIYAVAQHYLLSGDRASLEKLLPQTLKALDWCLTEIKEAAKREGPSQGLVLAPLNDLSHEPRAWAFNQAYLYGGLEALGRTLTMLQHPRAQECVSAAREVHEAVQRGFAHASMLSPLVQLRDHTWIPYVPSDALGAGRLLDVWYPTDVDCGSLHLSRLKALDPTGPLTTFLLNDHEDNLFLKQLGMANEPVYNQHATAYLLRDDVKPAIRAFYSMMACAFSQSVFEPVEHRWSWGQYFGPPSTDGAWFDLYRHMLIHERDDDTLLLCQATPRKWLENGKQIRIERAPTYYGLLNLEINSHASKAEISAIIELHQRKSPASLLLRLRHPLNQPLRSVSVNGKSWSDFDPAREWVRIRNPREARYEVVARY